MMGRYLKLTIAMMALAVLFGGTLWVAHAKYNIQQSIFGGHKVTVYGTGRIGTPIQGETIPSPSDFGFAVDATGGTFVCSMAGPATGGFAGFEVMLVQGIITPGSLQVAEQPDIPSLHIGGKLEARFSGAATVVLIPGLQGADKTILNNVPFSAIARTGKYDKPQFRLTIPAFTQALGGDTGGVVIQGGINKVVN
jgi:hypothetical protein